MSVKESESIFNLFNKYNILGAEVTENISNNRLDCKIRKELIMFNFTPSIIYTKTIVLNKLQWCVGKSNKRCCIFIIIGYNRYKEVY